MIKLRKFSLSDLEKVMEIEKASFPKSQAYSRRYFEKYYKEYPEGFIIANNRKGVVGYAIGKPKNGEAEIISLAVKPTWRKKGIGTELTNFLIDHFKENGAQEISLDVRTKNKVGIVFYQN